jgi:DNA polymerase-3 subunit gamma/tau
MAGEARGAAGARAASPAGGLQQAAEAAPGNAAAAGVVSVSPATSDARLPLTAVNWPTIIGQLGLSGLARQLASHCVLAGLQGTTLRLLLDPRSQSIRTRGNEEKLAAALARYSGEPLRVQIELAEGTQPVTPAREREALADERLASARAALEEDPNIKALRTELGATIFADSVRPNYTEEN